MSDEDLYLKEREELSTGNRTKISIVIKILPILLDPDLERLTILLLDEHTSELTDKCAADLLGILREIREERPNFTVVAATNSEQVAKTYFAQEIYISKPAETDSKGKTSTAPETKMSPANEAPTHQHEHGARSTEAI